MSKWNSWGESWEHFGGPRKNINLKQWHDVFEAIAYFVDKDCDDMEEACGIQVSPMIENIQWNSELECLVIPTWESCDGGSVEHNWITVAEDEVESVMSEIENNREASE